MRLILDVLGQAIGRLTQKHFRFCLILENRETGQMQLTSNIDADRLPAVLAQFSEEFEVDEKFEVES